MARAPVVLLLSILLLVPAMAGCLEEEVPDEGEGLPHEGTTVGFRIPDLALLAQDGSEATIRSVGGDYVVVHVVDPELPPFMPQFAQVRAVRSHWDNVTVGALTVRDSVVSDGQSLADLRQEAGADWTIARGDGGVRDALSIVRYPTVFVLDADGVILERSDEALGQGRIVQAIEATWGVEPAEDAFPEVNGTVPDLVWRDVDGAEGALSDLRGSPVLLNVWEMECPFCMALFSDLEKVYANRSAEGLRIVSIDIITWETEDEVRSVMEEYNATWTFVVDGDDIQSRYDIWRLPLLVLLDDDGVVQWTWTGYVHHSVIDGEVEKLI